LLICHLNRFKTYFKLTNEGNMLFNKGVMVLLAATLSMCAASVFAIGYDNDTPVTHYVDAPNPSPAVVNVAQPAAAYAQSASSQNTSDQTIAAQPMGVASAGSTVSPELFNQTVTRLAQNQQMTQQLDMQQMHVLQQQNTSLQDQISKMAQAMTLMHQQVAAIGAEVVSLEKVAAALPAQKPASQGSQLWNSFLHSVYFKIVSGALALLLIGFVWWLTGRMPITSNTAKPDIAAGADSNADYDFLSSEDAIPAKLDLARAYIAMEDFNASTVVLNDVFVQGNSEQKQEAQTLLNQIKQKTTSSV
jgi:FimV-like protein